MAKGIIRFIGDVHGHFKQYKEIIREGPPSIQVGDMGVGFRIVGGYRDGTFHTNPPHYLMHAGGHRFIRGNHDNPEECAKHSQYIPDGLIEDGMMFVGGAVSIDRDFRQEGYNWWPNEELSEEELAETVLKYTQEKPDIVVTHECPSFVAEYMEQIAGRGKLHPAWPSRTRKAFEQMWWGHKPKLWVFGHWHRSLDQVICGTRFVCLNELEYKDIDVDEVKKAEVPPMPHRGLQTEDSG